MTAPTDSDGVASAAEQDRRIRELAARNGRENPVTIRHVGDEAGAHADEPARKAPKRKPAAKLTTAERVRILDLRAEGATLAAIAREVGCSEPTVRRVVRSSEGAGEPVQERAPARERAPVAPLAQALAILDGELHRITELQAIRDRLAALIK